MSKKSTPSARAAKDADNRKTWKAPYPDFPLSFHPASGRLYKKICGVRRYFGYARDWEAAIKKYQDEKDDWQAGRTPRAKRDGLSMVDAVNRFLTVKDAEVRSGELARRSWNDYKSTSARVLAAFGKTRVVEDLRPDDFEKLKVQLQQGRNLNTLGNEIQRVRCLFKYLWDSDQIAAPVKFGPGFKRPDKKSRRRLRNQRGPVMFSADEIRRLLDATTPQMRAAILLGINCAFGNTDVAQLPRDRVDINRGWHTFGRPKTGVERRCPLWPETVEALRVVLSTRPKPRDAAYDGLLFLTRQGRPYVRLQAVGDPEQDGDAELTTWNDAISREIGKVLTTLGIKRPRLNFYSLRRTFRTVADAAGDQPAVTYIMGHADSDNDMGATYRQEIAESRLQAVVDHVHDWLFDGQAGEVRDTADGSGGGI